MSDEIDRWISYMRKHPDTWKTKHTAFINAQFFKHRQFLTCLAATPQGKQKIINVYNIRNVKGYGKLLETTSHKS